MGGDEGWDVLVLEQQLYFLGNSGKSPKWNIFSKLYSCTLVIIIPRFFYITSYKPQLHFVALIKTFQGGILGFLLRVSLRLIKVSLGKAAFEEWLNIAYNLHYSRTVKIRFSTTFPLISLSSFKQKRSSYWPSRCQSKTARWKIPPLTIKEPQ